MCRKVQLQGSFCCNAISDLFITDSTVANTTKQNKTQYNATEHKTTQRKYNKTQWNATQHKAMPAAERKKTQRNGMDCNKTTQRTAM